MQYTKNIFSYQRRLTREVMVGNLGIGGQNPIRIQSMTTSDTMDTAATVAEVIQLADAGCEIVRITAPTVKDAKNLAEIKKQVRVRGYQVPLVADIHFTPNAALIAAEIVEKVRINPGNYADKKKFEIRDYNDTEYDTELQRVAERFAPLVEICKKNAVAMRIGVNHGSLSDRVMNRFGDTPAGMVESALEFVRICEDLKYYDLVISMKSSNPQVMIKAYRMLALKMTALGMDYPFHLGVTEAGDGEDGRIKSAVGIGTLLEDGIGDTIRVSLTEDAVFEVPVAAALVKKYYSQTFDGSTARFVEEADYFELIQPEKPVRLKTQTIQAGLQPIGGKLPLRVMVAAEKHRLENPSNKPVQEAEAEWLIAFEKATLVNEKNGLTTVGNNGDMQLVKIELAGENFKQDIAELNRATDGEKPVFIYCSGFAADEFNPENVQKFLQTKPGENAVLALEFPANQPGALTTLRQFITKLQIIHCELPLVFAYCVQNRDKFWQLDAASVLGALLTSGIGNGLLIHGETTAAAARRFCYTLLQATRLRITKTEYISCPSCGRTLFNLQSITERIKAKTAHLKGVKIAIMGCIVNGPGEMADADFGYVGSGHGTINLFVGKNCVQRNIPQNEADFRLIELIKEHGMWVEEPAVSVG